MPTSAVVTLLLLHRAVVTLAFQQQCQANVWCGVQAELFSFVVGDYPEVEGRDDLSQVVIHLADIDEDKKVTFQEFLEFSEVFREKAFTAVDTNKDGKVVAEEALNKATKASFSIVEKLVLELFTLADLNKDGHLSTADLPIRKKEELDSNGDGSVSLKELLGHPIIFFPGPIQSVYKALDSNKDEIISKREARNFINFLGKLFNVMDVDSDCLVSLQEALTALNLAELPKDFQLALDLFLQPYTSLARYVTLAILQAADVDGDGGLRLEELTDFRSKVFLAEIKEVLGQIYSRRSPVPLGFMTGSRDWTGAEPGSPEEKRSWYNRALAAWLSAFQGFISQPGFNRPGPDC